MIKSSTTTMTTGTITLIIIIIIIIISLQYPSVRYTIRARVGTQRSHLEQDSGVSDKKEALSVLDRWGFPLEKAHIIARTAANTDAVTPLQQQYHNIHNLAVL